MTDKMLNKNRKMVVIIIRGVYIELFTSNCHCITINVHKTWEKVKWQNQNSKDSSLS
jgi:hypothetical protein